MEQMGTDGRKEYEEYKEELGRKLDETAGNFIVIGYILKQVRDRCLYLNDGYSDIYGFGMGTYGLSKATVSRFMNINTKFSIGGSSREIKPEYKGYGRSKLQEMLNIEDGDMELITAASTVEDIRELGKAEKAQQEIEKEEYENSLPLVRMAAGAEGQDAEPDPPEPFDAVLSAFWQKNMGLYRKVAAGLVTPGIAAEEISPSGSSTFRDGVNIMFFYDIDRGLKLRSYAKGKAEITPYTYQDLIDRTMALDLTHGRQEAGDAPEAAEVAEVQPEVPAAAVQMEWVQEPEPDGPPEPYVPVPGQTSVSDLRDVVPAMEPDVPAGQQAEAGGSRDVPAMENVIDGEYREIDGAVQGQPALTDVPYTDDEIRRVIEYYDTEYERMAGLHMEGMKKLCCRVARECVRRCYKSVAEQVDRKIPGTGA